MPPRTTIDHLGMDLLRSILARLSSVDFASADCVSRAWNHACGCVLCRPKLSTACSSNPDFKVAVQEVVNKVLSEPIRPHFAIASISNGYNHGIELDDAHQLISTKLGSKVPIIINRCFGIIGRNAISDGFHEAFGEEEEEGDERIILTIGFLPGMKVKPIPLPQLSWDPLAFMIDKFVTDIREFSISTSGRESPAAIMMFVGGLKNPIHEGLMINVMRKVDNVMPPETVIVGGYGYGYRIRHSNGSSRNITASEEHQVVALVFVNDKNKPEGVGETQFHSALSSGLRPVGPTYTVASIEKNAIVSELTVRRKGSHENLDGETILRRAFEDLGVMTSSRPLYIGITKRRKCFVGDEEVEWMTNLEFHEVEKYCHLEGFFWVEFMGIEVGDTLRFYHPDPTTALSSIVNVSNYLRSFKQATTTDGNKWEVFGGFIFTYFLRCDSFFSQPNVNSSPFLDICPSVPLGGMLGCWVLGRGDLTSYAEESQEQNSVRSFMHEWGAIYLIMSYSP